MAAGPLLVSEPLQRYRALGLAGDPVWRAAGQLRTAIAQRLSRKHADLLADPRGRSDRPAHRLVRAFRRRGAQALRARRRRAPGDLTRSIACTARSRSRQFDGGAAALERRAQLRPTAAPCADRTGRGTLYVVDGKPVMTFWGFTADASLPGAFLASPPVALRPQRWPAGHARSRHGLGARDARRRHALGAGGRGRRSPLLLLLLLALLAWAVPSVPAASRTLARSPSAGWVLNLAVRQPVELQKAAPRRCNRTTRTCGSSSPASPTRPRARRRSRRRRRRTGRCRCR